MIYQRAMFLSCVNREMSGERQQELHELAEQSVDAEEEECQDDHHDPDEYGGRHSLLPRRPHDLAAFGLHLAHEFAGAGSGLVWTVFHYSVTPRFRHGDFAAPAPW